MSTSQLISTHIQKKHELWAVKKKPCVFLGWVVLFAIGTCIFHSKYCHVPESGTMYRLTRAQQPSSKNPPHMLLGCCVPPENTKIEYSKTLSTLLMQCCGHDDGGEANNAVLPMLFCRSGTISRTLYPSLDRYSDHGGRLKLMLLRCMRREIQI
ncbi:hypothetical protein BHM03_00041323 [Ensete ventricosum]|nr:hypothetical protein BHM03_00041323 [Ensete ventricosum]